MERNDHVRFALWPRARKRKPHAVIEIALGVELVNPECRRNQPIPPWSFRNLGVDGRARR